MQWKRLAQSKGPQYVPHIFMFYLFKDAEPASKDVLHKQDKK